LDKTMSSNKFNATVTLAGILLTCVLYLNTATSQTQESGASASATQPSSQPGVDLHASPSPAASAPAARTQSSRSIYRRHPIDDRVNGLAKALDLNETQQSEIKTVLEHQQMQARKIQLDPNLAGADRNDRFRALQEDTVLRIRALLNDEQKKKYDPLNHGTQPTGPPGNYVDQWMKHHQQPTESPAPPPQK
jgi:periplasmic protein CpxP/Spy